jgi:hypothetical protein
MNLADMIRTTPIFDVSRLQGQTVHYNANQPLTLDRLNEAIDRVNRMAPN